MFESLPHEYIGASELPKRFQELKNDRVYGVKVEVQDYIRTKEGKPLMDKQDYFKQGKLAYKSAFAREVLPTWVA